MAEAYRFGIEEEYFLVDAQTKSPARAMPAAFLAQAKAATEGRVTSEFLQSQIEARTAPQFDMARAAAELRELRQTLARIAADHGLAIMAAGTHPTAAWVAARQTQAARATTSSWTTCKCSANATCCAGCTCMSSCPTPTIAST
jgi:carboxylate-amine ligase